MNGVDGVVDLSDRRVLDNASLLRISRKLPKLLTFAIKASKIDRLSKIPDTLIFLPLSCRTRLFDGEPAICLCNDTVSSSNAYTSYLGTNGVLETSVYVCTTITYMLTCETETVTIYSRPCHTSFVVSCWITLFPFGALVESFNNMAVIIFFASRLSQHPADRQILLNYDGR